MLPRRSTRRHVGFLAQRLSFDFELHDASLDFVDFLRHRVDFNSQLRRRFVNQIDGFVGQEAIADVAIGQTWPQHHGAVDNAHAMMHFVPFLQSAQNGDRAFDTGLTNENRLKATFECGVLFDVLAVFVKRRRADARAIPRVPAWA